MKLESNTWLFCWQIDPSIYGGLIVEFQQKVLDMSIRTRAQQMERLLREPVDLSNLWRLPLKETCLWCYLQLTNKYEKQHDTCVVFLKIYHFILQLLFWFEISFFEDIKFQWYLGLHLRINGQIGKRMSREESRRESHENKIQVLERCHEAYM